ncbi:MAG: ATP-dependent RecD-like DNA helicase [Desulfobacteraceae bacterium]|nr:MAG: ATP-dependent RecD-like DNA helicase [Desulfobacteraceae bacterium]
MIILEGNLERITFQNEENHYTIARLATGTPGSMITIVGFMAGISPGQTLRLSGNWETHPRYGQQFKIETFAVSLPETIEGIRKYLESGVIKNIGPLIAKRLVRHFGKKTLEVIEQCPERLTEVNGIGKAKAGLIERSWKGHHIVRELMQFLQARGIKGAYSARILQEYGEEALDILKKDPFRLAEDIPGIGFLIADTITRHNGLPKDDPKRVRGCIRYLIGQGENDGHTFLPDTVIIDQCGQTFQIDPEIAALALDELADSGILVREDIPDKQDQKAVYSKELHAAEQGIANRFKALLSVPMPMLNMNPEELTCEILKKLAIQLSAGQLEVLEQILKHRVAVITGGPGTGKTTLIRSVNAIFERMGKLVVLAAPTGRAAKRLSEVVQRDAKTIHRLLKYNLKEQRFEINPNNPIDADVIIIDEASMVDTLLLFHLIRAVPVTSVLILVGDVFQLPSVGPGNVLKDIIQSHAVPVYYLKTIFRQAQESPIIVNAHMVRDWNHPGEIPDFQTAGPEDELSEFYFIRQSSPDTVVETIKTLCAESIPHRFGFDPIRDIQVLTPMHKGLIGTINLNQALQKTLNPDHTGMEIMGITYKPNDKVMHLKNNYEKDVFNGDIGTIAAIDHQTRLVTVDYEGRKVEYEPEEMHELSLAYAISVHKSQGSEYPVVIVPLLTQHYVMLQRNLLYTAMTRGKKLVILIGTRKALSVAVNNDKPRERLSGLARKLIWD